ncbi:replication initiation protein [Planomicrobium sp. CPCC 101110]|uniref:replication initiation protein n=1 Tax=Planomicrobium sp. CPCC 101110 TaxID=2599619 RepID=UPI0011B4ADF5|nr:replication initiation protein [Planomicrobium sp. CPCC 101110]TWT26574.1 replication initiation protein [Planomicrobium sp. CPCC 101110]
MNENYLVTQGNNLIEARHKKPLTAREQKIILTMVSMIEPSDKDFKDYMISIRDFHEMLGLEGREHYTEIKTVVESLMTKVVEIPLEDKGWLMTHWVSTARYIDGTGVIQLRFAPELKPYLLQLKTVFTSYKLNNILSLKSVYAIRLYELMKKWQQLSRWECSIDSLRGKLGASNKSYNLYGNFKNKILIPAIKELNEQTDLFIQFTEVKKGRKVDAIEFIIRRAPEKEIQLPNTEKQPEPTEELNKKDELRTRLNELANGYQFDTIFFTQLHQGASLIWKDDTEKELELLVRYVNEEKTVKNPLGFIKSKITSAWEIYEAGGRITFADLQPAEARTTGRTEMLPEWFTTKDEPYESAETNPELEELKAETLRQLAKKKEDFARKKNLKT